MKHFYLFLSDVIMAIHFAWVLFNLLGFLIAIKFPKVKVFHLCSLSFTAALMLAGKICPLTILEQRLKLKADPNLTYQESFLSHYLGKLIYVDALPETITIITVALTLLALWFYVIFPLISRKRNSQKF